MEEVRLKPLFDGAPKLDVACKILASFTRPTFLENIAIDESGDLFVTSLDEGAVYKVSPTGEKERYASTNAKLAGIIQLDRHQFLCNGWDYLGIPTIYLLNEDQKMMPLSQPAGAMFFNGMTRLTSGMVLICDSYKGAVWKYDVGTNSAEVWLEDSLLARKDESNPIPGANGIKVFEDKVFISNTEQKLLLTVDLNDEHPGSPKVHMSNVNFDDFSFDSIGNLYASTHIYNSVVKVTPDKSMSILADASNGMAGSTAVMFGRTASDRNCLYVTTNGGLSLPLAEGLQDGKIVRLTLNSRQDVVG